MSDSNDGNHNGSASEDEQQHQEKGESKGPPQTVGLFHHSMAKCRLQVFTSWAKTVLILSTFILMVLSLYWAVLFHIPQNLPSLKVLIVDFDGTQAPYTNVRPLLGPMVVEMAEKQNSSPLPHLGYTILPPSNFENDPIQVRQAVFNQNAWAAIVVNANATGLLQAAVAQGNRSYDPLGACQVVYVQARDQTTYDTYITPQLNMLQTEIASKFGTMWTEMTLQNASVSIANLQAAPQALSPAIGFSVFNLRPFEPAVSTPAVSIGLIYLIIIAFFSFSFFLPIYMKLVTPDEGHPTVPFWQVIIVRYIGANAAYFFMSLFYSLISLAFQIPFANHKMPDTEVALNPTPYGKGSFPLYWCINFVGMAGLGLACENVAMLIGQPWTALWLIFWVISNVSTSFYSIELAPRFYYWGYAWPLQNIVEASRTILFGTHSRLGLNFGVLFCWVVANAVFFPFCCWFMRRQTQKAKGKK